MVTALSRVKKNAIAVAKKAVATMTAATQRLAHSRAIPSAMILTKTAAVTASSPPQPPSVARALATVIRKKLALVIAPCVLPTSTPRTATTAATASSVPPANVLRAINSANLSWAPTPWATTPALATHPPV